MRTIRNKNENKASSRKTFDVTQACGVRLLQIDEYQVIFKELNSLFS